MEWPLAREGGVHVPCRLVYGLAILQSICTKDSSSIIFFELVAGQRAQPLCSVIWNYALVLHSSESYRNERSGTV
jgi:hypothetical protein